MIQLPASSVAVGIGGSQAAVDVPTDDRHADLARAKLLDGRVVSLRCLDAEDADAVLALHQNLPDGDRDFRFLTLSPVDLPRLASALTTPDANSSAIGAFDKGCLIGAAIYAISDDPRAGALAIVIARDDHQRGVSAALLRHLGHLSRRHGLQRLVTDVLSTNRLMFTALSDAGWPYRGITHGAITHLEIDLAAAV
ncbi:GNAT family N-acetyltransferase [Candidatus Mycobacterium methanotrophicum]|uniref:GNAT family N-acetyltransferase n=1 Tax=Candidatus Mycobacterium methanotrophicum TaxID=2943498 RepID=A0ABY4QHH9_9MYCO|nr:GNAT family N-acetyltransferase [Candidatus Mycobacterium methanotrophicum]UQX10319.1 GNAT family N-acetyltransferase [Candidatus Mycobacterium methanotrophicum]